MATGRGLGGGERLLICRVGSHLCGLPLEHVVETMRPLPVESVAGVPSFVRGVSVIRGGPMAVLDARVLFGAVSDAEPERLVTLRLGERHVALLVDAVIGVRRLAQLTLHELPPVLHDASERVEALGVLDSELLLVLKHARLLEAEHFALLEARVS